MCTAQQRKLDSHFLQGTKKTQPFLTGHYGVQKISKIVINVSILIIKYAVERLDKNKHF